MAMGIIGGSSFLNKTVFSGLVPHPVETRYGTATVYKGKNFYFIQRHGVKKDILPHLINHKAHISAFLELGITDCIGIYSTGSYKKTIPPGALVIPDDFIDTTPIQTFYDSPVDKLEFAFTIPHLDEDLRKTLMYACKNHSIDTVNKGTYIQVQGPRLETKAEVRMYKDYSDIVGMTMATEATLCQEIGIKFASLCSVDNFGNGIGKDIDFKEIDKMKEKANYSISIIMQSILDI